MIDLITFDSKVQVDVLMYFLVSSQRGTFCVETFTATINCKGCTGKFVIKVVMSV
jgi:hypothetical protein